MERIIKKCLDLFEDFNNIEFSINLETAEIGELDLIDMSLKYESECAVLERQLNGLYLIGKEDVVDRINNQLRNIKAELKEIDVSIRIRIGKKFGTIKVEQLKKIHDIKIKYINRLISFIADLKKSPLEDVEVKETKVNKLRSVLMEYGLSKSPMLLNKSGQAVEKLIATIDSAELPYKIALLDKVKFIEHLNEKYFPKKDELYKFLSKILNNSARSVKGNCLVLNPRSTESKERYTSYQHKEEAALFLQNLK